MELQKKKCSNFDYFHFFLAHDVCSDSSKFIAVISVISLPNAPINIEEFTNNLKIRYQRYQV